MLHGNTGVRTGISKTTKNPQTSEVHFRPRLLIAEDDAEAAEQLREFLESKLELDVDITSDGKEALESLRKRSYSLFLTDLKMPRLDGMELIEVIEKAEIPVTVIVITGHGSIDKAVKAIQSGAYDFLTKPLDLDHLLLVIQRALRERRLADEVTYLREQLSTREAFQNLITKSPRMLSVLELIGNIAHTTTTVLIEGETGTGKEMIARAIHNASSNHRTGEMVVLNCAALPENLMESELFGHEKGAFTGANAQRKGRFEQAQGGTLFLDEIGEIPLPMQVKLLRVLQERYIERVGGGQCIDVDVRIIAATNRSLQELVQEGTFREDLYYRINVVRIDLPPLRERPEDIPILVKHFCEKYAFPNRDPKEVSPAAMQVLLQHAWSGNVRELENVIERACVTSSGSTLEPEHLGGDLTNSSDSSPSLAIDLDRPLPELLAELTASLERRYIVQALQKTRGNVGDCAKICGMSRRSISAKISEYEIDKAEMKQ